uniref:Uncharacterized protein n=1 Tax=Leptobrachium leishanense TaxID=445787 RepID=A0A8C5MUF2_9ANUR
MRYNDKELLCLSRQRAEKAAELNMKSSKKGSGFIDEPERKSVFECSCKEQCDEWIKALTNASSEFMRRSLIYYQNEIFRLTGNDPLEQYGISEESRFQLESCLNKQICKFKLLNGFTISE